MVGFSKLHISGFLTVVLIAAPATTGHAQTVSSTTTVINVGNRCPTPSIVVGPKLPDDPCADPSTVSVNQDVAAVFAWESFIALNWPAVAAPRETPDLGRRFGQAGPTVWETMRSKVEVYPGDGSETVGPHGAVIQPDPPHKATNPDTDFGYDDPPQYRYVPAVAACQGQTVSNAQAWIVLDETTQIGNNQTYAGHLTAADAPHNSAPGLIRYGVKINRSVYVKVVDNRFWWGQQDKQSPLYAARNGYMDTLAKTERENPPGTYVEFLDPVSVAVTVKTFQPVEVKSAWRPLTGDEKKSGRFYTATVRYFEKSAGVPCYREDEWGLIGMHVIRFMPKSPWVIWATFEQADNIKIPSGQPIEDENGSARIIVRSDPTSPKLSSNPDQLHPKVVMEGAYCTTPGARLYFRQNPQFKETLPTEGNICVNKRWHNIPKNIIAANVSAHDNIKEYLGQNGLTDAPWLYYKLINVQPVPLSLTYPPTDDRFAASYLANAVIETDYSLGNFSGDLVNGVPANQKTGSSGEYTYVNTRLLPFQSKNLGNVVNNVQAGGCAGCHAFAATQGQNFSFAIGDNVKKPDLPDAFDTGEFRMFHPFPRSSKP